MDFTLGYKGMPFKKQNWGTMPYIRNAMAKRGWKIKYP